MPETELTERQKNEIAYHREHARRVAEKRKGVSFDVVTSPDRRLHNGYWHFYTRLLQEPLKDKRVLVVGCGAGSDALRIAKMGASVHAFDLSPDMLQLARRFAEAEGFEIDFSQMPAENLEYDDDLFDYVVAIDILHHVDIPDAMGEIVRVAKTGCRFFMDEIYSHTWTDRVRKSGLVERHLYPLMVKWIYKNQHPYITEDERKLSEADVETISGYLSKITYRKYFNFVITRLIPEKYDPINKIDYRLLSLLGGAGRYVAGRVVLVGEIN